MKTLKSILAALAMTAAATAGAQTLKMEPQVTGITTSEISAVVSLVVVKPEIKIEKKELEGGSFGGSFFHYPFGDGLRFQRTELCLPWLFAYRTG